MAFRSSLEVVVGFLCFLIACESGVKGQDVISATCTIVAGSGVAPVYGTINIYHKMGEDIKFDVSLKGFNQSTSVTKHGFHIHENGSLGNKCNDAGPHYNPDNVAHAGPQDSIRHVGDLGNVDVQMNGEVNTTLTDKIISLFGDRTVLNRAFVVHETVDDLGLGNFSDSKTTGHAGARFGCCTILKSSTGGAGSRWSGVQFAVVAVLLFASLISSIF